MSAAAILVVPELRWRRWRWEVREHEVDIRRGTLTETRTLVPMQRVQHVDTRRDPLEQALGLATVVFHTAAGENRIPALPVDGGGRACASGSPRWRGRPMSSEEDDAAGR